VSARDRAHLRRAFQAGENGKFGTIVFVGTPGFWVGDVGEPLDFRSHVGELAELGGRDGGAPTLWIKACRFISSRPR
jgi:hypothetical protein